MLRPQRATLPALVRLAACSLALAACCAPAAAQDHPDPVPALPAAATDATGAVGRPVERPVEQPVESPVEPAAEAPTEPTVGKAPEPSSESAVEQPAEPPSEPAREPTAGSPSGSPVESPVSQVEAGPPALLPAGDPASAEFVGPPLVPPFPILDAEVLPGSRARLEWKASQSFAGSEVVSPVTVVHGTRPGPVLCLTAAIHGDELNGVEIVRQVSNRLQPDTLAGTVVGVPIVNLFGFSRNSRYLPDRRDLNRFFPGSRFGSVASRIAHSFFDSVARRCDMLVDFHTGSFDRSNLPQVRADLRLPGVLEFTRAFGATPVLHSDGSRGMLRVAATAADIPAVTFEVGAPARLQPDQIAHGVAAIDSLLHNLGMQESGATDSEPQAIFYDSEWVRADAGGLLISDVELGDRIVNGQRLGRVIDPINNIERDIVSPVSGQVLGMALNQVVLPGFAAYHLGVQTSEAHAVEEAASGAADAPVEEDPSPDAEPEPGDTLPPPDAEEEFDRA